MIALPFDKEKFFNDTKAHLDDSRGSLCYTLGDAYCQTTIACGQCQECIERPAQMRCIRERCVVCGDLIDED